MKTEVKKNSLCLLTVKFQTLKPKVLKKQKENQNSKKTLYHLNHSVLLQSSMNQF